MGTSPEQTCVYVSAGFGVHDRRWMSALRSLGHQPVHIARDHHSSASDFHDAVRDAAVGQTPVIAGPLEIALSLTDMSERTVLLSWGFDLQEAPPNLDLSAFFAVIVDSSANEHIAHRAGANQIVNIPWGIDLAAIDSTTAVADLTENGIGFDERVVLSLRAHEPRYRVADIITAFARRPRPARLVIGNSGSLTQELHRHVKALGVDAVFLPPVAEKQIPALLRRSSAYVTASEVDGTSVTLLQAMACSVPVVASANPGNLDWIDEGLTGFLFPIANVDALDAALDRALGSNPALLRAARSRVEGAADWQRNIHALRPIIQGER